MSLLRPLIALVLFVAASTSNGQERSAAQPFNTGGDVTNVALLQKVSYLQQVVRMLEEQVRNCGGATGSTGENLPPAQGDNFALRQIKDEEGTATHTNYRAPTVTPSPANTRRPAVGYQVSAAAESRLTCADYSRIYFSRHPAMAAVCKVDLSEPQTPPETETSPSVTVSVTTLISATARSRAISTTTR